MKKNFKKKHKLTYSIITGLGIIVFWRGIWGIMDTYFFPNNELLSYSLSILLGFLILYLNDFSLKELEH